MKKDMKKISFGLVVMLAALWGSSEAIHRLPDYFTFAVVVTGIIVFIIGGVFIAVALED